MVQLQRSLPSVAILSSGRTPATKAGVRGAPKEPGCYLFRDEEDAILYVGKSVSLRDRLASYFAAKRDRKTQAMVRHAKSVEWQTMSSEVEALIHESQLVKRYHPPYNVMLQDYPHYTFLRLNPGGGFPYLELASAVMADDAGYFGPFWGKRSAEQTQEFTNRLFALRQCSGPLPTEEVGKGCVYGQLHRCSAPCLSRDAGEYAESVRSAKELLRGDVGKLIARLERERDRAAEALRFEKAGQLQQTIVTLQSLQSKRRHLRSATNHLNFLVVVPPQRAEDAQVLAFSAARLRGQLSVSTTLVEEQRQALEQFLLTHYPVKRHLAIDLEELDQMHVVAEWLARAGRQAVYVPLPDGPLTAADAERAVGAVAQALNSGQWAVTSGQ